MGPGRLSEGSEDDCNYSHKTRFNLFKSYEGWTEYEHIKTLASGELFPLGDSASGTQWGNSVLVKDNSGFRAVINDDISAMALDLIRYAQSFKFTLTGHYDRTAVDRVMNALFGCDICLVNNKDCPIMKTIAEELNETSWSSFLFKEMWDSVLLKDHKRVIEITSARVDLPLISMERLIEEQWGDAINETPEHVIKKDNGEVGVIVICSKYLRHCRLYLPPKLDTSNEADEKVMGRAMDALRTHEDEDIFRVMGGADDTKGQLLASLILGDSGKLLITADYLLKATEEDTRSKAIKTILNSGERIILEHSPYNVASVMGCIIEDEHWEGMVKGLEGGDKPEWKRIPIEHEDDTEKDEQILFQGARGQRALVVYRDSERVYTVQTHEADSYRAGAATKTPGQVDDDLIFMGQLMKSIRRHNGGNPKLLLTRYGDAGEGRNPLSLLSALALGDEGNLFIDRKLMDNIRLPDGCDAQMNKKLLDKARKTAQTQDHSAPMVAQPVNNLSDTVLVSNSHYMGGKGLHLRNC
eukprot:GHVS01059463.1.p1 GENE.GHVS01059463.1~~GHVS01059463.1.p1  ORF type:complete len:526 (+),score=30.78 GHVS01059463.1:3-1580(+)